MQTPYSLKTIVIFSNEPVSQTFSLLRTSIRFLFLSFNAFTLLYAFNFQTLSIHLLNCLLFIHHILLWKKEILLCFLRLICTGSSKHLLQLFLLDPSLLAPPAPLLFYNSPSFYLIPLKLPFYLPLFSKTLPMSLSQIL